MLTRCSVISQRYELPLSLDIPSYRLIFIYLVLGYILVKWKNAGPAASNSAESLMKERVGRPAVAKKFPIFYVNWNFDAIFVRYGH
jgi:hypothetical protein